VRFRKEDTVALVEIQVMPSGGERPADQPYYFVDRAIDVIKASGLRYEVEPMGTTIEGDLDAVLETAIRAMKAPLEAGADGIFTILKVSHRQSSSTTMQDLVGKHRT
jgi:uncharacterized protein (TIGR00106 family)